MLCLCHYGPALLGLWCLTDLGRENSASFLKIQAGKTFSYHGHALVTFYVQFLCSDRLKFDRWVHVENLCSILKVVYFDRWSWQSFVSTLTWDQDLFLFRFENIKHSGGQGWYKPSAKRLPPTFLIDWLLPNQPTKTTPVPRFFSMQIFHTWEKCRLAVFKNSFYLLIFSAKNKTASTIAISFLRD